MDFVWAEKRMALEPVSQSAAGSSILTHWQPGWGSPSNRGLAWGWRDWGWPDQQNSREARLNKPELCRVKPHPPSSSSTGAPDSGQTNRTVHVCYLWQAAVHCCCFNFSEMHPVFHLCRRLTPVKILSYVLSVRKRWKARISWSHGYWG